VLNHYRDAIRSGQPVRWEEESVYPAGRRYGEVAVTPLYDASGIATHLIGIVHDITERKRMEKERAEGDRLKDEFLSLLGHELRNPLAAISTGVQLLSGGVTDEERVSLNGMMDRQVKLMQRLLDDLLDLGRITHGHIQLKKERIDLAKLLQHVTVVTQSTTAERRQEMILRLPAEVVTFEADEARLEQIAINLLSNASKYTAPGGRIESLSRAAAPAREANSWCGCPCNLRFPINPLPQKRNPRLHCGALAPSSSSKTILTWPVPLWSP